MTKPTTTADRPTFDQLAALEPRLLPLLDEARRYRRDTPPRFCANATWYGYPGHAPVPGLKAHLLRLVGWERPDRAPPLATSYAYDVAYDRLYDALPDCRPGCVCQQLWAATGAPDPPAGPVT
jgi:hypothetical protein